MLLIAQNHFQLILEVGLIILAIMIFAINLVPLSLSVVTFLSLFLSGGFALLFLGDFGLLVLSFGQNEFTHPFGPIALLAIVTALASLKVMEESGVNVVRLKKVVYAFLIGITIFGGLMHKSFLLLWILGLFVGYLLISKSFRQKTFISLRRIMIFLGLGVVAFGLLELLSWITSMDVFSPMLRLTRIERNSLSSLRLVIQNTHLIGHDAASSYWGADVGGFADGYISLPMSFILMFGLPYPLFFGLLVSKKDAIDYMVPGIFGYCYDFGYITLILMLIVIVGIIIVGLLILRRYRVNREKNNKKYLGKEVLLIGSLTAFIAQTTVGLFFFNRTINGMALLTFLVLGSLVLAHSVSLKRTT